MGVLFLGFFRHWDGCVLPVLLACSDDVFTDNAAGVRGWNTAMSQRGRSEVNDGLLLRGWGARGWGEAFNQSCGIHRRPGWGKGGCRWCSPVALGESLEGWACKDFIRAYFRQ